MRGPLHVTCSRRNVRGTPGARLFTRTRRPALKERGIKGSQLGRHNTFRVQSTSHLLALRTLCEPALVPCPCAGLVLSQTCCQAGLRGRVGHWSGTSNCTSWLHRLSPSRAPAALGQPRISPRFRAEGCWRRNGWRSGQLNPKPRPGYGGPDLGCCCRHEAAP